MNNKRLPRISGILHIPHPKRRKWYPKLLYISINEKPKGKSVMYKINKRLKEVIVKSTRLPIRSTWDIVETILVFRGLFTFLLMLRTHIYLKYNLNKKNTQKNYQSIYHYPNINKRFCIHRSSPSETDDERSPHNHMAITINHS